MNLLEISSVEPLWIHKYQSFGRYLSGFMTIINFSYFFKRIWKWISNFIFESQEWCINLKSHYFNIFFNIFFNIRSPCSGWLSEGENSFSWAPASAMWIINLVPFLHAILFVAILYATTRSSASFPPPYTFTLEFDLLKLSYYLSKGKALFYLMVNLFYLNKI